MTPTRSEASRFGVRFDGTRAFDLVTALLLAVCAAPVMLLAALAIRLADGGPVFYRQTRIGLDGRPFEILKLRSMCVGAERDGEARWAEVNDPRVTRVGRYLRRWRIDELPQLVNVLRGEMCLIGPRPERPQFVATLSRELPGYTQRHTVKPGITGWAQVRHRYAASTADAREKLRYDLDYIHRRSLVFDLLILVETARVVVTGAGAQ